MYVAFFSMEHECWLRKMTKPCKNNWFYKIGSQVRLKTDKKDVENKIYHLPKWENLSMGSH